MARATAAMGAWSASACCNIGSLSLAVGCAEATAGHTAPDQAANEPPNNLMNSRRFTRIPFAQTVSRYDRNAAVLCRSLAGPAGSRSGGKL